MLQISCVLKFFGTSRFRVLCGIFNQFVKPLLCVFRITYFKGLKDSANPFNLGLCRNVFVFFCNFHPYDWTAVYSKTRKSTDNLSTDSGIENDEYCEIAVGN